MAECILYSTHLLNSGTAFLFLVGADKDGFYSSWSGRNLQMTTFNNNESSDKNETENDQNIDMGGINCDDKVLLLQKMFHTFLSL